MRFGGREWQPQPFYRIGGVGLEGILGWQWGNPLGMKWGEETRVGREWG